MLATNHAFNDSAASADRARPAPTGARPPLALHAVPASTFRSGRQPYRVRRPRGRLLILGLLFVAHAIGVWLAWNMAPWGKAPAPSNSVEVALITPPVMPPPAPRQPVKPRLQRIKPMLQPPEILPPIATPQAPVPLTVPLTLTLPPAESPVASIAAPVVVEATIAGPPVVPLPRAEITLPRFDAAYLDNPAPSYPAAARRAREEGRVLLRVLVSAEGRAQTVQIVQSSGSDRLDEAAVDAVRRWSFVPARRGDEIVAAHVQVPLVFSLRR